MCTAHSDTSEEVFWSHRRAALRALGRRNAVVILKDFPGRPPGFCCDQLERSKRDLWGWESGLQK